MRCVALLLLAMSNLAFAEEVVLEGHTQAVLSVAYSSDGKTLASGSADHAIRLWDVATNKTHATLEGHSGAVNALAFSPDGKTLASVSEDKTVKLWDVAAGELTATLQGHTFPVVTATYSPDGKTLATGAVSGRDESPKLGEIKLWETATNKDRAAISSGIHLHSLAYSPDGTKLAAGCQLKIHLWDAATDKELASPWIRMFGDVKSVAYHPDGKSLASGGGYLNRPSETKVWDIATGKPRAALNDSGFGRGNVKFSPDGKTLLTWVDRDLKLWDTAEYKERETRRVEGTRAAAFSPDSQTIAVGCNDKTIKIWVPK